MGIHYAHTTASQFTHWASRSSEHAAMLMVPSWSSLLLSSHTDVLLFPEPLSHNVTFLSVLVFFLQPIMPKKINLKA